MADSGKRYPLISLALGEKMLQCVRKGEGGFGNHYMRKADNEDNDDNDDNRDGEIIISDSISIIVSILIS